MTVANAGPTAASLLGMLAPQCRKKNQLLDLASALRDYHATPSSVVAARAWASVDLWAAFLSEDAGLPESERRAKHWGRVEGAVQVLVFVPILVTWVGLASAAFGARAGESMLQAWEAGSVPGLGLKEVALYTAAIVAALIALTAALAMHRWRLERDETRLRPQLADALTQASLELSPLRLGITKQIAEELDKAADKLAESAGAIEAAGQTASVAQQAATTAVTAVLPALTNVEIAAKASREAATELGAIPGRLTRHLDRITEAVGGIAEADRTLVTSIDGAVKQLADSVATSTSDLSAATSTSAATIAGALDSGSHELRDALGDVTVAAAGYASRTEVAADVVGRVHEALAALPAAVDGLRDGMSGVGGQLAELTTAISAAKDAAALLLEAVSTLRNQSPALSAAENGRPARPGEAIVRQ
ncbi:MAG: hypothetical protein JWM19_1326 [Actinomycetia bacterium]|jgi:hypothetical protein|nr:hypothetical protein [Actinomycetes bacterium]